MINDGTSLSFSDSEMAFKIKRSLKRSFVQSCHDTFDKKMKFNCHALKLDDDDMFKNRSKIPAIVLGPLKAMLYFEVGILSLQQLEYEVDCTDYPVD